MSRGICIGSIAPIFKAIHILALRHHQAFCQPQGSIHANHGLIRVWTQPIAGPVRLHECVNPRQFAQLKVNYSGVHQHRNIAGNKPASAKLNHPVSVTITQREYSLCASTVNLQLSSCLYQRMVIADERMGDASQWRRGVGGKLYLTPCPSPATYALCAERRVGRGECVKSNKAATCAIMRAESAPCQPARNLSLLFDA